VSGSGDVVARLRGELEVERRELAAAYEELRRFEESSGSVNLQAVARRVADAENGRAAAEYQVGVLSSWRGVRLGMALAESARPSSLLGLPSRVREALVRVEAPAGPEMVHPEVVMAELAGSVPRGPRWVDPVYPNVRVVHWGSVQTFVNVAGHVPLALGGELEAQIADGGDVLLVEPSTLGRLGDVDLGSAVAAFREAGVPVVLFARVAEHVDLPLVADVDVVMVEDPVVAGLARSRVGDDRVLEVLPSVDAAVFNPVDWQRDPAGGVGLFVSYPPRELDLAGERWLFDACGSDLDVFVSSSSALPAWLQGRVRGEAVPGGGGVSVVASFRGRVCASGVAVGGGGDSGGDDGVGVVG